VYWVDASSGGDILHVFRSSEGGLSWDGPAIAATGTVDRPWVTAQPDGVVYVNYRSVGAGMLEHVLRSVDHGATFTPLASLWLGATEGSSYSAAGHLYVDPHDPTHLSMFFFSTPPGTNAIRSPDESNNSEIRLAQSHDSGLTWMEMTVASPNSSVGVMTADAMDESGNLYIAASVLQPDHSTFIELWQTTDGGATFRGPIRIDQVAANLSNALPWISARRGHVVAAWYTSTAPSLADTTADWTVAFAESNNLLHTARPAFTQSQASAGIVHHGAIGLGSGDRSLADFIGITLDTHGTSYLAWTDTTGPNPRTVEATHVALTPT
jgi:hypothetical protein